MSLQKSKWITLITYLFAILVGSILFIFLKNEGYSVIGVTIIVDVLMTLIVFIVSIKMNNSSVYDPYWSVIPPFIVIGWMWWFNAISLSNIILLIGVSVWAIRLTRNWLIDFKGYSYEDFRYVDFRNKFGKMYWVISLLGIHLFPTAIVLVSLYPIMIVIENGISNQFFILLGTLIMVIGAAISFVADNQLRTHKEGQSNKTIRSGLWKYSRHPNYFGEVFFWFGVYIASLSSGVFLEASIGIFSMLLLFNLYSIPKMEKKLLKNKDDYYEVVQSHPRFFIRK